MKNRYLFLTVFSLLIFKSIYAQKHDNIWLLGYYESLPHPDLGGIKIDFSQEPPLISEEDTEINFSRTNASICDINGDFLFATNGAHIFNKTFGVMENGDSINPFGITFDYYDSGMTFYQAALTIPRPEYDSQFILFHQPIDWTPELSIHFPSLLYSVVDQNKNGGLGAVIEKNTLLIQDTLMGGKMTATRHGNGRDWWVVTGEEENYTNNLYSILIMPNGVEVQEKQNVGPGLNFEFGALGQATFSPDGKKYFRHDVRLSPPFSTIDIYDFDRCTGLFTHLEHFELGDTTGLAGGAVVSPDSRYLYIITAPRVYQYDLTASDIVSSQTIVAEFDGHIGYFFESTFGAAQLGPNGKIYFVPPVQDTVMHIIETPGQGGADCKVQQHAIALPKLNLRTIPNFPNYRLGPLDGSPCDTLGLDNFPVAGFAHFAEELAVTFSDNSHYRPETWEWDFGDSNGSSERNPVHAYNEPGEYEVCLTVANENGEDTFCRWVEVDTVAVVSTVETVLEGGVELFPNPASTQIKLRLEKPLPNASSLELYDPAGRRVKTWGMAAHQEQGVFWLGGVPRGLYLWKLKGEGRTVASGKVMLVR